MHRGTVPSLDEIMACRRFGLNPLYERMLANHHSGKCDWKFRLQIDGHLFPASTCQFGYCGFADHGLPLCVRCLWIIDNLLLHNHGKLENGHSCVTTCVLSVSMGLLPDTQNCGLRIRRECRERLSYHRLQRKPLVSDPDMLHGTCVTHVP